MAELNDKEKRKFDVIKKVYIGEITKEQTQKELNLGIRQINRLLIKLKMKVKLDLYIKTEENQAIKKFLMKLKMKLLIYI
ncbi:MAG TPA: hypothetical protein OIM42_01290 [Clostridiaceae bacterium]|nr:hypothetical protein [Clostridiaceae bacterium]